MDQVSSSPAISSPSLIALPGPIDRVSFFEEQKRNRRATWRLAAACGLAIIVMGIPLCIVLTPLLYALSLIVIHTVNLFTPIPAVMQALASTAALVGAAFEYFLEEAEVQVPFFKAFLGLGALLLPGIGLAGAVWLGVYTLFRHAGVGGVLLTLGARPPRPEDLEEKQLTNLVEEMAIAAGVPPPRVMLLDSTIANAAVVGSSVEDAVVVVSHRILDEFDRDETQGVIGHLVGSIGNGDLRIAFLMTSVFLAFGVLVTFLSAPFGPQGRAAFMRLLRVGAQLRRQHTDDQAEAELVSLLLTQAVEAEGMEDFDKLEKKGGIVTVALSPFIFVNLSTRWTLFVFISFLVGPLIALLWRARRYLADASAVQLTRNPDGLAYGLDHLVRVGGLIPGSQQAAHLFIIGSGLAQEHDETARQLQKELVALQDQSFSERSQKVQTVLHERQQKTHGNTKGTLKGALGGGSSVSFHPPLDRRYKRLHALGSTIDRGKTHTPHRSLLYYVGMVFIGVLMSIGVVACLAGVAIFVFLSLFFMGFLLVMIHGLFSLVG
ncbi:MAG: M48 family metalloprotease [Candidatus Binatia bacterium]